MVIRSGARGWLVHDMAPTIAVCSIFLGRSGWATMLVARGPDGGACPGTAACEVPSHYIALCQSRRNEVELQMLAHSGVVHLDKIGHQRYILSHSLTNERISCTGEWSLMVDVGGVVRAALVQLLDSGEAQVTIVEDILRRDVGKSASGERFLLTKLDDGSIATESLDTALSQMRVASVQVKIVSASSRSAIAVYVLRHTRACAQQVFWSLIDLYHILSLTAYNKQASKWVFHRAPSWGRFLSASFPGRLVLLSKHANGSRSTLEAVHRWDRALPQTSMCTLGLLFCLARWAFATPERGGLRETTPRRASLEMLRSLLEQACQAKRNKPFDVIFEETWVCRWPRPQPLPELPQVVVSMKFCEGALVDMSILSEASLPTHLMRTCTDQLRTAGLNDHCSQLPVVSIMEVLTGRPQLQSIIAQFVWALSLQLEAALCGQATGKFDGAQAAHFDLVGVDFGVSSHRLDEQLFQYAMAPQKMSQAFVCMSLAANEVSAAGMCLHNSCISWPNGVLAMCCPQVGLGHWVPRSWCANLHCPDHFPE